MTPKVKICGITNLNDAEKSLALGADALGFNFYKESKRFIPKEEAAKIIKQLSPFRVCFGVFVNETVSTLLDTVRICNLNVIQLHGDEDKNYISSLKKKTNIPIIKVFRIRSENDLTTIKTFSPNYCFVDSFHEDTYGGTGKQININLIKDVKKICNHIILAGGLTPDNLKDILTQTSPYAVDVASGVEKSPGLKDHQKLKKFINMAKGI